MLTDVEAARLWLMATFSTHWDDDTEYTRSKENGDLPPTSEIRRKWRNLQSQANHGLTTSHYENSNTTRRQQRKRHSMMVITTDMFAH